MSSPRTEHGNYQKESWNKLVAYKSYYNYHKCSRKSFQLRVMWCVQNMWCVPLFFYRLVKVETHNLGMFFHPVGVEIKGWKIFPVSPSRLKDVRILVVTGTLDGGSIPSHSELLYQAMSIPTAPWTVLRSGIKASFGMQHQISVTAGWKIGGKKNTQTIISFVLQGKNAYILRILYIYIFICTTHHYTSLHKHMFPALIG